MRDAHCGAAPYDALHMHEEFYVYTIRGSSGTSGSTMPYLPLETRHFLTVRTIPALITVSASEVNVPKLRRSASPAKLWIDGPYAMRKSMNKEPQLRD